MANEKGTISNPYSYSEFQEMLVAGTWNGGYVDTEGGILYYNSDGTYDSGDSEGCGCGCGEGCGCDIRGGQESFRPECFRVNTYFEISWGNGSFSGGSQPPLTVTLVNGDYMDIINIHYSWENSYRVAITFDIVIQGNNSEHKSYDYNIPHHYYS